ncbi:MAG: gamma-glutamyl-gamma-aminobutyrate hydrolase family protein [Aerococcus sp.]|nr:gamma-glutamyl-gamma-aminobutyrate hydrolase family protein [Aerococcus sp.]
MADKPLIIGITGNSTTNDHEWAEFQHDYTPVGFPKGIEKTGNLPMVIPMQSDLSLAEAYVERVDGLIFTGGQDVSPLLFNEEPVPELQDVLLQRDQWEIALFKAAQKRHLPILAVCRGLQLINCILGGSVYQDYKYYPLASGHLPVQHIQKDSHMTDPAHSITLAENTTLAGLFPHHKQLAVNSFHHQVLRTLAPSLTETAWAADGVIEAFERPKTAEHGALIGVQWHPELMIFKDNTMLALFDWFNHQA